VATPAVTPQPQQASDENPFDAPLASEGGQAPTATKPDEGNPFDEPLESEKAEQEAAQKPDPIQLSKPGTVPNARIRNMPRPDDPSKSPMENFVGGAAHGAMLNAPLALAESPALARIAVDYGKPAVEAIKSAAASHPLVAKLIGHALETVSGITIAKYMNLFGKK
jgi:hypothetical protein